MGAIDLGPSDSDVVESPAKEDDFESPSTNESPEAALTAAFAAIAPEALGRKHRKQVVDRLCPLSAVPLRVEVH